MKITEQKRIAALRDYSFQGDKGEGFWPGLEKPISQKGANRFLLGAIIDYQIPADKAWERSEWIAYKHFKGTADIWKEIAKYTKEEWHRFCKVNSVHRFPAAYDRIYRIGDIVRTEFKGDARNIWKGQDSAVVRQRLIEMRFGEQLTNMVLGALYDVGEIKGVLDVKADSNVTRVLGRVLKGQVVTKDEAIKLARLVLPENPWLLDGTLYWIGKDYCKKTNPICEECDLSEVCQYCTNE